MPAVSDVIEAGLPADAGIPEEPTGPARSVPGAAVIATGFASAAAAWMVGGLFKGIDAYVIGFLGVVIGTGLMYLARRGGTYRIAEYLALPLSALVGVLLLIPDTGDGATVGSLVSDALSRGGFLTPPGHVLPRMALPPSCAVQPGLRRRSRRGSGPVEAQARGRDPERARPRC